jgi:valyl-tRNA synthetase
MKPLAEKALEVVLDGEVKFYPNHWIKTYEHWMTNIRDWCISRQLWWGHRIPVYYAPDGKFTAATDEKEARAKLGVADDVILRQDEDVLDTWFSSWIWPLTTMRWLEDDSNLESDDMKKFLPTDLLVTAPDIIFFWVARMIMSNTKFDGRVPFKDVYFTSTIRDGKGRKLSKSLGNSPDPLNIIAKYGADAVRFTMLYLSPLGQDVKMDVDLKAQDIPSMEIGRNFANKIWNAGRFILMKKSDIENFNTNAKLDSPAISEKWILSRLHNTIKQIDKVLDNYKVNEYSKILYDFIWRDFCDWYIEIFKVSFNNAKNDEEKSALVNLVLSVYLDIMKLLHPLMPFITEELYHIITGADENESINLQDSPEANAEMIIPAIEDDFAVFQMLVDEIRSMRSQINLTSQKLPITIVTKDENLLIILNNLSSVIKNFGKAKEINVLSEFVKPSNCISSVVRNNEIHIILDETIDLNKEKERMIKERDRLKRNIKGIEGKLGNANFVNKAPANVVAYEREKLENMKESLQKILTNIESLK